MHGLHGKRKLYHPIPCGDRKNPLVPRWGV
jgi:hypothetical protein